MSLKVNQFAGVITNPLNIHNFAVSIPDADIASLIVAAASFPTEKLQEVKLYFQGEEIVYPTIAKNDHSWKIKVPENDDGKVRAELDRLKSKSWNQKTGIFIPASWSNVSVFARDLAGNVVFSTILHGAWLLGRDQVDLQNNDATKNWEWDYEFRYQWLEDKNGSNPASPNPMS